jgi:predicted alpha/beta superfamily hydrolase
MGRLSENPGRLYRIFVSKPKGTPPPWGYPVIYVTDANAWFLITSDLVPVSEAELGPSIVVGVGYATDILLDPDRFYDLTESASAGNRFACIFRYGGAEAFGKYINEELKPLIKAENRVDDKNQTLIDHSLGGLFVLHVLFTNPQSFNTHVAASPSIWWNNRAILEELHGFESHLSGTPKLKVLITVGDLEQQYGADDKEDMKKETREEFTKTPAAFCGMSLDEALRQTLSEMKQARMVDNAKEVAAELSERGIDVEFVDFPGEDHMSEVPPALNRAVRFALKRSGQP